MRFLQLFRTCFEQYNDDSWIQLSLPLATTVLQAPQPWIAAIDPEVEATVHFTPSQLGGDV